MGVSGGDDFGGSGCATMDVSLAMVILSMTSPVVRVGGGDLQLYVTTTTTTTQCSHSSSKE